MRRLSVGLIVAALGLAYLPVEAAARDYRCIAVAKTRHGKGKTIAATMRTFKVEWRRGAPAARKRKKRREACRKARALCGVALLARKLKDKNPNAKCVVLTRR